MHKYQLLIFLASAAIVSALSTPAFAQTCAVDGVPVSGSVVGILSETMESPPGLAAPGGTGPLAAGSYPPGQGVRLAQATEVGTLFEGCGTLLSLVGAITVHAQSRILYVQDASGQPVLDPVTGLVQLTQGPITGSFQITTARGVVPGKLSGSLDFSATSSTASSTPCGGPGPCPLVFASGTWSTQGSVKLAGGFVGLALVPFQNPQLGPGWFYLDPLGVLPGHIPGTPFVPLDPVADFSKQHGMPEAKFVITLYQ